MCDYGFGFYVGTGSLLGVLVWCVFGLVLFVFLDLIAFCGCVVRGSCWLLGILCWFLLVIGFVWCWLFACDLWCWVLFTWCDWLLIVLYL